jgi:hypothetical protein
MTVRPGIWILAALAAGTLLAAAGWAGLAPVGERAREQTHVIPKGTWARRMAGDKSDVMPNDIRLTLGVRDVLVMRNEDEVPQMFGPVLMMPGQSFRLPFNVASRYDFACTAHVSGSLTVHVDPEPGWWRMLRWRVASLLDPRAQI